MKINIIILNYNGEKLIPRCLPSVIEAKRTSQYPVRITVIDNESVDGSIDILERFEPEIEIIRSKNRVFCSFNNVVRRQEEEIAILLNNDIRVDRNFIDPMIYIFETKRDAFMVAPKCFNFEGNSLEGGRSKGFIDFGWFGALMRYPGWELEIEDTGYTFQSGFGAVRRDRFLELGGYDNLYLPGRLEDSDICFRAWKRGWKCYYQPDSIVYHKGGAAFKEKFGLSGISAMDSRNSLLFFWKNITDWKYWAEHVIFLPLRVIRWLLRGEASAVKGILSAFPRIPAVLERRQTERKTLARLSDSEIFRIFM